jgi:hypothetical protein
MAFSLSHHLYHVPSDPGVKISLPLGIFGTKPLAFAADAADIGLWRGCKN